MRHRLIKQLGIAVFILIQVAFLLMILIEKKAPSYILIFIGIMMLLMVYAHTKSHIHQKGIDYDSLKITLWTPIGALVTFVLAQDFQLGGVLSAAVVGVGATIIPKVRPHSYYFSRLPEMIYCGAFVGMSVPQTPHSYLFITIAGIVTAFFLAFAKNILLGIGGRLGSFAFAGVVITTILFELLYRWTL